MSITSSASMALAKKYTMFDLDAGIVAAGVSSRAIILNRC